MPERLTPTLTVATQLRLVGWHSWPDASGHRAYLAALHRHTFHVAVEVKVSHDDRAVEFHDLADQVRHWWGAEDDQRDRGSCEAMAIAIANHLGELHLKPMSVAVGEDGESWARFTEAGAW